MKRLITISFLLFAFGLKAQEVRLGMVLGTNISEYTHVDLDILSPANSYYTYIEENPGEGLIKQFRYFNSMHIGAVINLSYRRFGFNFEPQFFYKRTIYNFKQPQELDRIIGTKAFRMPFYFTYKFFKKETSAYFLFGYSVTKGSTRDFQHPGKGFYLGTEEPFAQVQNYGNGHFDGVLYDNQSYVNFLIGLGKQFKKLNWSIRYMPLVGKSTERMPLESWRVETTFSWLFLSSKDFTRKHPLYIDE